MTFFIDCDHIYIPNGMIWGSSGPLWTILGKNDFFAPNGQSRVLQRCFGAKYQFLFETVHKNEIPLLLLKHIFMKVLLQITFFLSGSWLIYNSSTERYSLQFRELGKENYSERKRKKEILSNYVIIINQLI